MPSDTQNADTALNTFISVRVQVLDTLSGASLTYAAFSKKGMPNIHSTATADHSSLKSVGKAERRAVSALLYVKFHITFRCTRLKSETLAT
jgi:hypothetical protein